MEAMSDRDQRLDGLPDIQRQVVVLRFLGESPRTLAEVGKALGLSREQVRAYEAEALALLAEPDLPPE